MFTVNLNGFATYQWLSPPVSIQSGGCVQHVFYNVKLGTYNVTAKMERVINSNFVGSTINIAVLGEQNLEFTT